MPHSKCYIGFIKWLECCARVSTSTRRQTEDESIWGTTRRWPLRAMRLGFHRPVLPCPCPKHTISFALNQTQGLGPYYLWLPLTSISLTCDWFPGSPIGLPDMCPDHVVPISSSAYSSHLGTIQNLLHPSGPQPSFKRPSPNTVAHVADSLLWLHFDIRGRATPSGSCLLSLCHFLIDQKVCLPLNFPNSLKVEAVTSSSVCDG